MANRTSSTHPKLGERIRELGVEYTIEGSDPGLEREVDRLLASRSEPEPESIELAAAAIELACIEVEEPLPAALHDRLVGQARSYFRGLACDNRTASQA